MAESNPDSAYDSANSDFEKGNFDQASKKYEAIINDGHISKDLFFNLATSLYRSDDFGRSVLWLRRALVLKPNMPEVAQDMAFLQSKLGFIEFSSSRQERILRNMSPALFRWITSLGLWTIGFALVVLLFVRRMDRFRGLLITGIVFCGLIVAASFWAGDYRAKNLAIENFATVIAAETKGFTAPALDAQTVIELPPGSELRILQKSGHWTYVGIPGDTRAWVRTDSFEGIWPIDIAAQK